MGKMLSIATAALAVGGFAASGAAATPRMPAAVQQQIASENLVQVRSYGHGHGHGHHGGHRGHGRHGHGYRGHGHYGHGHWGHGYHGYGHRHHYHHYGYNNYYGDYYPAPFFGFFPGFSVCVGGGYWGFYGCGW